LTRIVSAVSIPVQFGGGLRDIASIGAAFEVGVARVVIGTAAIENPALVSNAIARFGVERVAVGVDARAGMVATRGWREQSHVGAVELAQQMRKRGVTRIIYTDIARDGMLRGIDADAMADLARASGTHVIASGGVASLGDVEALRAREGDGIEGVIIGQALYTGAVSLREAIDAGKTNHTLP
jgi:phosphoribosylformimino-5-aminoimidazole carboxamide ribotide isomerase